MDRITAAIKVLTLLVLLALFTAFNFPAFGDVRYPHECRAFNAQCGIITGFKEREPIVKGTEVTYGFMITTQTATARLPVVIVPYMSWDDKWRACMRKDVTDKWHVVCLFLPRNPNEVSLGSYKGE
jgi:hypothetical protein